MNSAASDVGQSEHSPEAKKLSNAALAAHWGVSLPYITKLRKPAPEGKALPDFTDLAQADAWRAMHAPPRGRNAFGKNRVEQPPPAQPEQAGTPGEAGHAGEGSPANIAGAPAADAVERPRLGGDALRGPRHHADVIDIRGFIKRTDDFDGLMLKQAQEVPQIAYGLFQVACRGGDPVEISAQLKNWSEAGKQAGAVREKFVELQEKARTLLPLDEVEDVVGTFLQEVRRSLLKLDERVALAVRGSLSPEQTQLVQAAAAAEIDAVFRSLEVVPAQTRRELAS